MEAPLEMARRLDEVGYLADRGLATAAFLAVRMGRPLLCEGDAGTGKTTLAQALAEVLDTPLVRLQCHEGLDASQALYDWDFPRQLLHLRAAEAAGVADVDRLEGELYDRRFLLARPLLQALERSTPERPSVLLVDELDRADDEFEAFLLEVLADAAVTVPELGTIRAARPPVVVLTSNRTRELHDALKRRCLYVWLDHPSYERELAILRRRLPEVDERLSRQVATAVQHLRALDLVKPPGLAEALGWARALHALGMREADPDALVLTLGAVLKYREDQQRVTSAGVAGLLAGVAGA